MWKIFFQNRNVKLYLVVVLFLFQACKYEETTEQPIKYNPKMIKDTLIKANKFLLEKDKELIESYIARIGWDMNFDESGLWYEIYKKTSAKKIVAGDIVKYNFKIELLDGTVCYSSDKDGIAQVKIGMSGKEFGLEKGLLMMRVGEKAHFILPPHLAHGLIGDMDKIPSRSIIVYDIEILKTVNF